MRAGKLDRCIRIERQVIVQSDSGEEQITWQEVATVYAEKIEDRGQERFAHAQIVGSSIITFRIRWSQVVNEVSDEHRIVYEGREHDITAVREIGRRAGIEMDCVAHGEEPLVP